MNHIGNLRISTHSYTSLFALKFPANQYQVIIDFSFSSVFNFKNKSILVLLFSILNWQYA